MQNEVFATLLDCFFIFSGFALLLQTHTSLKHATYERATEICSTLVPRRGRGLQRLVDRHYGMDNKSRKSCHDIDRMEMAILSSSKVLSSNTILSSNDVRFANVLGEEDSLHVEHKRLQEKQDHPSESTLPTATLLEQA